MFPSKLTLNYNLRNCVKTQYHCSSLLPAIQVQVLSKLDADKFLLTVNNITRGNSRHSKFEPRQNIHQMSSW